MADEWTPEMLRQVYRIVDQILPLPPEMEEELKNDLRAYEEERGMAFIPYFEREARAEGEKEGRKIGEGQARAAMLDIIEPTLELKYGEAGVVFARELRDIVDFDTLHKIAHAAFRESKTIDELRAMLPKIPASA